MIIFDSILLEKLVKNEIKISDFEIGNFKIGNSFETISVDEIIEIHIENELGEFDENYSNFTIKERFEKLNKSNGYLHMAGGLSCTIESKTIKSFTITGNYLAPICEYKRDDIIKYFGKPDYELIDDTSFYGGYSYEIKSYILVYKRKGLSFIIHPKTEKIIEIDNQKVDIKNFKKR